MRAARGLIFSCMVGMAAVGSLPAVGEEGAATPAPDERIRAIVETPLVVQVPGIDAADITVRVDVPYTADAAGPELDVYLPSATAPGSLRPAVVFVHGGPLPPGQFPGAVLSPKDWRVLRDWGRTAAALGWVGVVANHRYRSLDALPASAADLDAVFAYLRAHAEELGIDSERTAIWLFSGAGPHLAPVLEGRWPEIRCAVAYYPVLDLSAFAPMGLGTASAETASRFDPTSRLRPEAPPLLIVRAGLDSPELLAAMDAFVTAALARGPALDVLTHPTGRHGFDIFDDQPRTREIVEHTLSFLQGCFAPAP